MVTFFLNLPVYLTSSKASLPFERISDIEKELVSGNTAYYWILALFYKHKLKIYYLMKYTFIHDIKECISNSFERTVAAAYTVFKYEQAKL